MNGLSKISLLGLSLIALAACSDNDDKPIVVGPAPDTSAPQISVNDQQIMADTMAVVIALSISDDQSATSALSIVASSSDQAVIKNDDLIVSNNGDVTLSVTPQQDTVGSTMISLTATDEAQNTATQSFTLDVLANQVAATQLITDLTVTGEDQEPSFINAIELNNDIESDAYFDDLFTK